MPPAGQRFGAVLILILLTLGFELASPDGELARVVTVLLQGLTLVAALHAAGTKPAFVRAAIVISGAAVLGTIGMLGLSGDSDVPSRILLLVLAAGAPVAIGFGLVGTLRADRQVTVQTMFAVLCIYLLIGLIFSTMYGVAEAIDSGVFLNGVTDPTNSDFLYFSFVTLTTTGYGDITAATNLGRSFAITEALIGQIYLVTVVALIVSNIGRQRPQR